MEASLILEIISQEWMKANLILHKNQIKSKKKKKKELTVKMKKSSINIAPNGRMPAMSVLKNESIEK